MIIRKPMKQQVTADGPEDAADRLFYLLMGNKTGVYFG